MESSLISRHVSQKSKKRVLPGGSSVDPDVVEIPQPVDRRSKSKALKIKEEIIDVDMDQNRGNIMLTEGIADYKGKGAVMINSLVTSSALNHGSVDGDQSSKKSSAPGSHNIVNLDGFGSDLSYLDDDYDGMQAFDDYDFMQAFDDNQMYNDEYAILQPHFHNIDIPPGVVLVEPPVPWFLGPPQNKSVVATTNSSTQSIPKLQPSPHGLLPGMGSHSWWSIDPWGRKSTTSSSTMGTPVPAVSHPHEAGLSSLWSTSENAQSKKDIAASKYFHHKTQNKGWGYCSTYMFTGEVSSHVPQNPPGSIEQYDGIEPAIDSAYVHNNIKNSVGGNGFLSGPFMQNASEAYPDSTNWFNLDNSMYPMASPDYPMHFNPFFTEHMLSEGVAHEPSTIQKNATDLGITSGSSSKSQNNATYLGIPSESSSKHQQNATIKHVNEDEILKEFQQFKNFDIVQDPSDHHYVHKGSSLKRPSTSWSKKIQEEWKILEKDLPDTIFVRAYESRMDLLRAVIVGAEGTPYHDGLFFFDVFFPDNYPNVPPHVYYHSRGLRLNPNLYNNGKVCLSLLNTWSGSQKEMWIPKLSTMLQVLVSIQGLILNAKPYFNEPAYAYASGTLHGEKSSQHYNESTFILSLKTMVFTMKKQPKDFEDFVVGHFFKRARDILVACKAYMDGAQVGCLVQGGIQDVDEGDKSCSHYFKASLGGYIKTLVGAFTQIGLKDCERFIPPAQTGNIQAEVKQIGNRLMPAALKTVNYFT